MADVHSRSQRSYNMSRIRSRDTGPEVRLRSALHRDGMRFRLQGRELPGTPDIVMAGPRVAVFVNGCFWHRHEGCKYASVPASNTEFWTAKFRRNVERDKENIQALEIAGWTAIVIWECELRSSTEKAVDRIRAAVDSATDRLEVK